jgi:uncharacterized protein YlxW (UPF0749 family)
MTRINWSGIWESIVKNKRLFIYALLAFALVVAGLWVWQGVGNWWTKSRLTKEQENVNRLTNEAQQINANLANLKQQEFEKQVEVNAAKANVNAIRTEVNEAQEIANQERPWTL